jgi:uncharacterized membrane protein
MTQARSVQPTALNNLVLEDSIEIPATISDVYRRWSDFAHFPQFMSNVEEVTPVGGNRYHWVARIFGVKQEWDAEVTENTPERNVAWQSITGSYNAGAVTFIGQGANKTLVRVRFEYAPPGGKVGQALDQLTQTTRREVHEDLENFKKLYTGGGLQAQGATSLAREDTGGLGRVMGPLTVPIATSVAGGIASYLIGRRLRESKLYNTMASPVAFPNAVAGWALIGASAASIVGSATLRSRGRATDALFVGQWAPTLLGMGTFARVLGHRGVRTNLATSVTSWTYFSACLGSVFASAFLHLRGKREDGLFVGQWAPTLLNAAIFTRLFDRLTAR